MASLALHGETGPTTPILHYDEGRPEKKANEERLGNMKHGTVVNCHLFFTFQQSSCESRFEACKHVHWFGCLQHLSFFE